MSLVTQTALTALLEDVSVPGASMVIVSTRLIIRVGVGILVSVIDDVSVS
jgi:hypothetical protein